MALKNIDATTNADMIGLDNNPTFTISNMTIGPALKLDKLFVSSNSSVALAGGAATIVSTATLSPALTLGRSGAVGNGTVPLLVLSVSGASVPVLQLASSSFTSVTTILFTTGAVSGSGAIRVLYSDGTTLGWIPVLPSGSVTAATAT